MTKSIYASTYVSTTRNRLTSMDPGDSDDNSLAKLASSLVLLPVSLLANQKYKLNLRA